MRNSILKLRDPINGLTHVVGAILALGGFVWLLWQAALTATAWHVVSFAIYGTSLLALYTTSALYHSLRVSEKTIDILRQLDHAMIYFLIAGTYTPMCLVVLRGGWGWSLFGINWGLAVIGITLKLVFRYPPRSMIVVLFILFIIMGWLVVVAWVPLVSALPSGGVQWLVWGGLFYSLGAIVLNMKRLQITPQFGAHEIWHFFVMAGSFCHFWLMLKYILPLN